MNKDNYKDLLKSYLDCGYKFVSFKDFAPKKRKQIILRHDVDFDIDLAYEIALIDNELGIKSSFFFLTHGCYNFNTLEVKAFQNLGHFTGLHLDYDVEEITRDIPFTEFYSIHRPDKEDLDSDKEFSTYNKRFFKKIEYASDSNCKQPNRITKNGQLLLHPIWWALDGTDRDKKLNQLKLHKEEKFTNYLHSNMKMGKREDPKFTCEP